MAFGYDGLYNPVNEFPASGRFRCLHHHPHDRLCPALPYKDAAILTQRRFHLANGILYVLILPGCLLILYPDVFQDLRVDMHRLC